jgi:hypothetical protein
MLTNYLFPKILHAGADNVEEEEGTAKYDN